MTEYTYKDVIIDPEDPRIEIGAEYYYCNNPSTCLERAINEDVAHLAVLEKVYPNAIVHFFIDDAYSICLIRKKEPEKKYVPFDLSKPEVRDMLRGKWIREKCTDNEFCISTFIFSSEGICTANGFNKEVLLKHHEFLDGTPCGELVEVEEE